MITNERYTSVLKFMSLCVNQGESYLIKELSHLELEKMKEQEFKIREEMKKLKRYYKIRKNNIENFETLEKEELKKVLKGYSQYIMNVTEKSRDIEEMKERIINIEEFVERIKQKKF